MNGAEGTCCHSRKPSSTMIPLYVSGAGAWCLALNILSFYSFIYNLINASFVFVIAK